MQTSNNNADIIQQRADVVRHYLKKENPDPKIELNWGNPLELLVAVILSAQCTDKRVNLVTEKLFKKYTTLDDYADANFEEFGQDIRSTGFYNNKAKNIIGAAQKIRSDYGGNVPDTMKELLTLPGVARKTANVVLWSAFGKKDGIAVDTHVKRLANKFKLTKESNPDKIEKDLMKLIPREEWGSFNLAFVLYGRYISTAKKKNDWDDPISKELLDKGLL